MTARPAPFDTTIWHRLYNEDCIEGCRRHVADDSVDLIITDPPYGIEGGTLHKHYNRDESFVLDEYEEVPRSRYARFSEAWIAEAERILRPGGSIYLVSGYTNLPDVLNALRRTSLRELNHIIWKYNFGVYTRAKYVSSHYHILFYVKPGARHTFNTGCRYGPRERSERNGSANYEDREDVWVIPRQYKPGRVKNKNELPPALLMKMMQYSSREGDLVADLFLGSFATAKVAVGLNRRVVGFEKSRTVFQHRLAEMAALVPGHLLEKARRPQSAGREQQGKRWRPADVEGVLAQYDRLRARGETKRSAIDRLSGELGRGYFSIYNVLKKNGR